MKYSIKNELLIKKTMEKFPERMLRYISNNQKLQFYFFRIIQIYVNIEIFLPKLLHALLSLFFFFKTIVVFFFKIFFYIFSFNLFEDETYLKFIKQKMFNKDKLFFKSPTFKKFVKNEDYTDVLINGDINKFIHASSTFLSIKILSYWQRVKGALYLILIYFFKRRK